MGLTLNLSLVHHWIPPQDPAHNGKGKSKVMAREVGTCPCPVILKGVENGLGSLGNTLSSSDLAVFQAG